jgi:TPR repeat protein
MALHKVLPAFAIFYLFVSVALAQAPLPTSTQAQLATDARLEGMTLDDFTKVVSQAQAGQREAQYLVALAYEEGRLVTRDLAAAASWMLKSAEQEYVPAQAGMGKLYIAGVKDNGPIPHRGDAEKWFRLAAAQGDADAQFWLGTAYQRGWFGGFDDREAFQWLRKAAAQGLPNAQFSLGQMYEDGEGVPESDSLAASWYRKAADHSPAYLGGVWEAEVQLAYMYRDGRLKDKVQTYMWFAIVGSSVDPPTDDDMTQVARHMTRAQIVQAQRLAEDWIKRHPWQRQTNVATSPSPTL